MDEWEKYPTVLGRLEATMRHIHESTNRRLHDLETDRRNIDTRLDTITNRLAHIESTMKSNGNYTKLLLTVVGLIIAAVAASSNFF